MANRRIIFECRVGSHLFGTNTPASDEDFHGVFLPSTEDLLGLYQCPTEWRANEKVTEGERNGAGDVDRKYFSLQRFLQLALQGQPAQLEMLCAPASAIVTQTEEWDHIKSLLGSIVSRQGVRPFLGFALSQAHKTTIKGENLNKLRELIAAARPLVEADSRARVGDFLYYDPRVNSEFAVFAGVPVTYLFNFSGFAQIEVAGRQFNPGILVRSFLEALLKLESRYGKRSEAAAVNGIDYKSLSHAVRLVSEAEEFLLTGRITLPRPDAAFILAIKQGHVERDWFAFLTAEIDRLERDVLPLSPLPNEPDAQAVAYRCERVLKEHLNTYRY